ncbi:hypothetical protein D3C87_1376320 [compost metagenome]
MKHRLTVKAKDINAFAQDVVMLEKGSNRVGMSERQVPFEIGQVTGPLLAACDRLCVFKTLLQPVAEACLIAVSGRRPPLDDRIAVGAQQRHVDSVHARPAHQADRGHDLAHAFLQGVACLHSKNIGQAKTCTFAQTVLNAARRRSTQPKDTGHVRVQVRFPPHPQRARFHSSEFG